MSLSGFFSSITDKAQSAINQTPLAGHIHGTTPAGDPSANQAASQGGYRSFALESLQHQIRNLGQQYTSTNPLQRIITLEKGVALDIDALARDGKTQSKELYTWGQDEDPDLTDVTDRLAFLNYVHASLSAALAVKLDDARSPLKALRSAEAAIVPKRNIRAGLRHQIARIEHNQEKGGERRLAELKEQLSRAESKDEQLEKEIELLKRKAVRESEQRKWEAFQEYAEKLVLLSQAAKTIIGALPTLPPTAANPYAGAEVTAAARASLQHALDNYKPGPVDLKVQIGGDLSRSDTRSFGESHASELSSIVSLSVGQEAHPGLPLTPPIPEPASAEKEDHGSSTQPLPAGSDQSAATILAQPIPTVAPTIGGTGVLLSASEPSPVSGPLYDVPAAVQDTSPIGAGKPAESASEDLYGTSPAKTESAEEEKKRLEREERERVLAAGNEILSESAEEEKKRLEREERERVLAGGANATSNTAEKDGEELPPYQDFQA